MNSSKPAQLSVRKEVQDFVLAAEKLLSPILRSSELTSEECYIISEYLMTMCRGTHPWSSQFVEEQNGQPASDRLQSDEWPGS